MSSGALALGVWNTVHWRSWGWAMCTIIVVFKSSGSSRFYHPWRACRFIPSCIIFCSDQIKYHKNYTSVMRKVGWIVKLESLLVGFLRVLVLGVDLVWLVNTKGWLQVLDYKWCLEVLFVFQLPLNYSYCVEVYPI